MAEDRMLNDEILLGLIKANGGGGGGGTTNYNLLENKPQIAGTELQGNKSLADLGIASASDLAAKQNALTAGDYIEIDGNEISVNPVVPNENVTYEFKTKDASGGDATVTLIKKSGDTVISSTDYRYDSVMGNKYITVDNLFYFGYSTTFTSGSEWGYKLLAASADHAVNYTRTWGYDATVDYTENFTSIDHSGENLVLKAQMDTALAGKQNTLTFDDTPTDGSNNPVKSNGIYDALATKADTDMVAADFNAGTSYTAGNYCVQDGKLYKFKNNHSGAWSSADVDEVKITGELSSLKSGLTNLHYHKVAESASTGTYADKLSTILSTYSTLSIDQRKSAKLVRNDADYFNAVNYGGAFSAIYLDNSDLVITCFRVAQGEYIYTDNGNKTDASNAEDGSVLSLWVCE